MSKKYKLLKDTVEAKEGSIFKYSDKLVGSISRSKGYWLENPLPEGHLQLFYTVESVENNPEWFKEIEERTDLQIKLGILLEKYVDSFQINKEKGSISVPQVTIDRLIENVTNTVKELEPIKEKISLSLKAQPITDKDREEIEKALSAGPILGISGMILEEEEERRYQSYLRRINESFNFKSDVEKWREEPKVVFTTHDGICCIDGAKIYGICLHAIGPDQWREVVLPFKSIPGENRVWFDSKDKANDYLIRNKKCLSIDDITDRVYLEAISINHFKKLVKERI
jgi:hypothetical protein